MFCQCPKHLKVIKVLLYINHEGVQCLINITRNILAANGTIVSHTLHCQYTPVCTLRIY